MEKMTKKEKFKKFVYDHRETIAQVTLYTTLIAGGIAVMLKANSNLKESEKNLTDAVNEYNSWVDEENEWLDEKHAEGKMTYLLHDLTYLLIPKDTEVEWVGDRKPAQK